MKNISKYIYSLCVVGSLFCINGYSQSVGRNVPQGGNRSQISPRTNTPKGNIAKQQYQTPDSNYGALSGDDSGNNFEIGDGDVGFEKKDKSFEINGRRTISYDDNTGLSSLTTTYPNGSTLTASQTETAGTYDITLTTPDGTSTATLVTNGTGGGTLTLSDGTIYSGEVTDNDGVTTVTVTDESGNTATYTPGDGSALADSFFAAYL